MKNRLFKPKRQDISLFFLFYSKTRAIMAKRTIEDSEIEDSKIDFK